MNKKPLVLVLFVVVLLVIWLAWPSGIDPVAWTPPPPQPLTGDYAKNDLLKNIQPIDVGVDSGPGALTVDAISRIYVGYADGRIVRLENGGDTFVSFAKTVGRPLALSFDGDAELAVVDSKAGLVHFDVTAIAQPYRITPNPPARSITDVARSADSESIFITDGSSKFDGDHRLADLLEHRPNGRLLSYNLKTHKTRLLLSDLYYPTGVAVGPDENFVLVNESGAYRITRLWLKGPKAGTHDVFVDNLPGLPGALTFNGRDRFWVSIPSLRNATIEGMAGKPWLRGFAARLPGFLQGWLHQNNGAGAFVLAYDVDGKQVANLQYAGKDSFGAVSAVVENDGWLFLGRTSGSSIGRLALNKVIAGLPPPPGVDLALPENPKETVREDKKQNDNDVDAKAIQPGN